MTTNHRERAEMYARAEYFAWAARRRFTPCESDRDPMTGLSFKTYRVPFGRGLEAAANVARARYCYAAARRQPVPGALMRGA